MLSIYKQNGKIRYGVKEYILDTVKDVASLPTDPLDVKPGSIAFVVDSSETYMLNNAQNWVKIITGSTGGTGSTEGGDDGGFLRIY